MPIALPIDAAANVFSLADAVEFGSCANENGLVHNGGAIDGGAECGVASGTSA